MKAIPFKGHNTQFAEEQPEYLTLPAFADGSPEGLVVTCWQVGWWERIRLLFSGRVWLSVLTFNNPLQPLLMEAERPDFLPGDDQ